MAIKPTITIVGPGRLGVSLVEHLAKAGYSVREIVFPNANSLKNKLDTLPRSLRTRASTIDQAAFDSNVVWLCVPDGELQPVASKLSLIAKWKGKVVFHSSGALPSDALQTLRKLGASVASVHPLMTFVHNSHPGFKGVPFALEGDRTALITARRIVKDVGGKSFAIKKRDKAQYHAWGTFLSPLLLAFMVTAEQVARSAGIPARAARKRMLPIVQQTLSNYTKLGPEKSFSGPLVRGDAAVVRAHLESLKGIPEAREAYKALAKSALGHLPVRNRKELEKLLKQKSS